MDIIDASPAQESTGRTAEKKPLLADLAIALGLPVFPCRVEDKRPMTAHGFKDASRDPEAIRRMFGARRVGEALIGVPTGAVAAPNDLEVALDKIRSSPPRRKHPIGCDSAAGVYAGSAEAFGIEIKDEQRAAPAYDDESNRFGGWSGASFLAQQKPRRWVVKGLLPRGAIYFLTGRRGTGKTTFEAMLALAICTGRDDLLGLPVKQGRVALVSLENSSNFREQILAAVELLYKKSGVAREAIFADLDRNLFVTEARGVRKLRDVLAAESEANGFYSLVAIDTLQAAFAAGGGDDFNSNAELLKFTSALRGLTKLPGEPHVLVAAHPTKSARGADDLEPFTLGASGLL